MPLYASLCLPLRNRLHQRHDGDPADNKRQPGAHDRHAQPQPDHVEARHLLRDDRAGVLARKVRANPARLTAPREGGDALQPPADLLVLLPIELSEYVVSTIRSTPAEDYRESKIRLDPIARSPDIENSPIFQTARATGSRSGSTGYHCRRCQGTRRPTAARGGARVPSNRKSCPRHRPAPTGASWTSSRHVPANPAAAALRLRRPRTYRRRRTTNRARGTSGRIADR